MSNTTNNALPLTEADINKPQSDAPAAGAPKAKATKSKTTPVPTENEMETNTDTSNGPSDNSFTSMVNEIIEAGKGGPESAREKARAIARRLDHYADIFLLSRKLKSCKNGDAAANTAAVEQLNQIGRRKLELSEKTPADFTIGGHGLYAGLTPSGTYGAELGVVSKGKDRTAYTGIGLYFRCEHLENDGVRFDSSGLSKK